MRVCVYVCMCLYVCVLCVCLYEFCLCVCVCPARVWKTDKTSNVLAKMLPHPSFVYTAKFHRTVEKIVVTGGYDRLIRVWSLQTDELHALVSKEPPYHH